ncbi:MAG: hypothetical protein BWX93_01903 [Bacteroidetes bacterium ADurb.Bin139]|nr:MAG: hypothetical protein BWX93_01903 [Bacteroidetes bacterium ADurb.Bin139]
MNTGHGSIEILIFHFPDLSSVYGVGIVSPELFHIKFYHTAANFFVGSKGDLNRAVFYFRMCHQVLDGSHDGCHAGLVVCSQKCGAICSYQGLTLIGKQFRELGRIQV